MYIFYWPYFQGWTGLPNAKHHQLCQKIKGSCWIGRKVWLCYVFWKKDKRNPKPDYFAIIFILMTSGQVSRARCLEAAHHNQHHVPSSGSHRKVISSKISNMDHLIIFFSSQTATGFHAMRGYTVLFQEVLTILMNTPRFLTAIRIP